MELANFFLGLLGIHLDLSSGCRDCRVSQVTLVTILHLLFHSIALAVIGKRYH